jgi:hypothetical protein
MALPIRIVSFKDFGLDDIDATLRVCVWLYPRFKKNDWL